MIHKLPYLIIPRLLLGGALLATAVTGAPAAWAQDAKDREIQELKQRLDRLEKELGVKKEAPPTPAAAPAPGAPAAAAEPPPSIGDRIKTLEETIKGTPTHVEWALREWSVVPMPANTDATITGVKSALRWFAEELPSLPVVAAGSLLDFVLREHAFSMPATCPSTSSPLTCP